MTQGYTKCRYSPSQVLSNQAGIAAGNVSLLLPFGVAMVLVAVYCYQICSGRFIPRGYSKSEKDKALEALAICLLLAKDNKLEAMKRQHQLKKIEKQNSEDDSVDYSNDIEEEFSNLDLTFVHSLVNELSYVGVITREEYFRLQEEKMKEEAAAIDWASLCESLSKKNKKPRVWNNVTATTQSKGKGKEQVSSTEEESQRSAHSLTDSATQIELPTVSALHLTSIDSEKVSIGSISGAKKVSVLNQTPVNQKSANKYHQLTAKLSSKELVNSEPDNGFRSREASTAPGSRGGTLISVDLDSLQKSAHLLSAIDLNPSDISETNQNSTQSLFSTLASASISAKYSIDIVQLLIKYWIPKLDNWIEEFRAMSNPQSTASSTKFWLLASNTSELQLFTIMTKDDLRSLFLRLETQTEFEVTVEDVSIVLVFLTIFEKIKQLMIFHASLSMQCAVDQIEKKYDRRIGYLIGEEVWTLLELTAFIANTIDLRALLEGRLNVSKQSKEISDRELSFEN